MDSYFKKSSHITINKENDYIPNPYNNISYCDDDYFDKLVDLEADRIKKLFIKISFPDEVDLCGNKHEEDKKIIHILVNRAVGFDAHFTLDTAKKQ